MTPQAKIKQEIVSTTFCVAGLCFMLIGFYIFADKLNLSVVLGTIIASAISIGNFILNIYTGKHAAKYDKQKAIRIVLFSKVIRAFLMGAIIYFLLLTPLVHSIIALFFPQISRAVIHMIRN